MVKIVSLITLSILLAACSQKSPAADDHEIVNSQITVDGEISDWESISPITVQGADHLWIGEGLPQGEWQGNKDLSFNWRAAHADGKLYFLFEVNDDKLSSFDQPYSWLNDCIEIYLDHQNIAGDRITEIGPENSLEDRIGKRLRGHEMHFLPAETPKVFFNDTEGIYYTDSAQTIKFNNEWHGKVVSKKTDTGYLIETGFAIPNFYAQRGDKIGIDVAVCDDDGDGRKSLLLWSGYKGDFWLTMDDFKKAVLK